MDIIIGLLVAGVFVILVIALILAGGEKSRDKSDKGGGSLELQSGTLESKPFDDSRDPSEEGRGSFERHIELHSKGGLSESEPFDYGSLGWKKRSRRQREQEKWRCQACNLSLHRHKYYLHTHHIWGTRYNEPEDLRVLCIGCHSEQPGENHYRLKRTRENRGFMKRYGRQWRRGSSVALKRG